MRTTRVLLVTAALAAGCAGAAAAHNALRGIVSRGTSSVAVGDSGLVFFSTSLPNLSWVHANVPVLNALGGVTTGASDYVTVGELGMIERSADGTGAAWTTRVSPTTQRLWGVGRLASRYLVAVGDSGTIVLSGGLDQDGWRLASAVPTRKSLRAVYGGSVYAVAVGDSGTVLWTGTSDTLWHAPSTQPSTADLKGVTLGPGASPGRFWAVGAAGTMLRSLPYPDTWEVLPTGVAVDLHAVAFWGQLGVAVGDNGTILYSNGGQSWTPVDSPTQANLYAVAYCGSGAGGRFIAVGDGAVMIASDLGTSWSAIVTPVRATTWGSLRSLWNPAPPPR